MILVCPEGSEVKTWGWGRELGSDALKKCLPSSLTLGNS